MRLIDADKLQEHFERVKKASASLIDIAQIIGVQAVIDSQPTAYNVDGDGKMIERTEYGVRTVTTKKVFPKIFETKEDAEKNRQKHTDPEHWEIVKRDVLYGEWELDKN